MGPGKWGLERPSAQDSDEGLGFTAEMGDKEGEEDHVAGLVERIAYTMLEEDEEETRKAGYWGGICQSLPRAQLATQVSASNWGNQRVENVKALSGFPEPVQKRIESEAMELLYAELVRLKMEELAVAQQQLSLYQNAFLDAKLPAYSGFTSSVGFSNMSANPTPVKPYGTHHSFCNKGLHRCPGGSEWSAPNIMQCQGNGRSPGQRLGAPLYPTARYLTKVGSLGVPALRESGGTGVFLPRCRAGARNLRTHDSKRKPEPKFQAYAGRSDTFLPGKAKENVAERSSLQYPSCSLLQEVAPDISLPTEWTY